MSKIQDFVRASRQTPALGQIGTSASPSAKSFQSLFEDSGNIDSNVGGSRKNQAKLVALIRQESHSTRPRADFHRQHLQLLNAAVFECGHGNAIRHGKLCRLVIQQLRFKVFYPLVSLLLFVPKRAHSRGCVERRRGNGLADRLESSVGLTRVFQDAISTNELDARLFFGPLDTCDQNRTDFSGRPDVGTTACGTVVAGDVDYANVTAAFRGLPQSGFADVLVGDIANRDTSIFPDDSVGE